MNFKVLGLFGVIIVVAVTVWIGFGQKLRNADNTLVTSSIGNFVEVSEITSDMLGNTKETRGIVTVVSEGKGNVFFTLKDIATDAKIRGVLFAKTNNDDPKRKQLLLQSRDKGSVVYITGGINIYQSELEIKVWQVYTK